MSVNPFPNLRCDHSRFVAEIDSLRAELAELRASRRWEYIEALEDRAEKSEAALARVRELCASHAGDDDIPRASVLAALEGEQA